MFAPLVDVITGRVSAWKAKNSAAYVTLVDPVTGEPAGPSAPLQVRVILPEIDSARVLTITDGAAQKTSPLPPGTTAVRIQKTAGVSVRWRVAENNSTANITTAQGGVLLADVVGFVDVPAVEGNVVQVIRASGDTGTGVFAATPLGA